MFRDRDGWGDDDVLWDWAYAREVLPDLLEGLQLTVKITLLASLLALTLGFGLALARHLKVPVLATFANGFMQFFRNTPLLVQLYMFFYALPQFGIRISAVTSGILILGMHTGSYMAEVYRAGIESVHQEQWDASTALNLPTRKIWTRVVIPQALPPIVPVLGNYINEMFKLTAYVATIGAVEMFGQGLRVAELSYSYFVPLTMVGLLYLSVSITVTVLLRRIEARNSRSSLVWTNV